MGHPLSRLRNAVSFARKRAGLTQEELAERAGIDRTYLSEIERGQANPTYQVLVRLSEALGVSICDLLCKEDNHED